MSDVGADFSLIVTPAPVRSQIEANLRRAILRGYFRPGQHLSDKMLCDLLRVSRPVVREAVRLLAAEGLVETIPHKGAFVKTVSVADAAHIYEVRAVLEALLAKTFAENASDAAVKQLREVYGELEQRSPALEQDDVLEIKQRFYTIMLEGAGNPYLTESFNRILSRNTLLRSSTLSDPDRLPNVLNELLRIVDAIERRDAQATWDAAYQYVQSAAKVAMDILGQDH